MFIIFLKFSVNKGKAGEFMQAHNDWIKKGFDEGVFLLVGSLQPGLGGGIVAHNSTLDELEVRVKNDPFVAQDIVTVEVVEFSPSKADERLAFLLD